jgi:hypothetical protein
MGSRGEVTVLLGLLKLGHKDALEKLMPLVYRDTRSAHRPGPRGLPPAPAASAVAVRTWPVALPVMATLARGTTAPAGSVTVPVTVPWILPER